MLAAAAAALVHAAAAEEGGSGHYVPGTNASFIDVLTGTPSFTYMNIPYFYDASRGASRRLQLGGVVAAGVEASVRADASLFVYEPPWKPLGASYGAAVAIPYVSMEVSGSVQPGRFARLARSVRDTADGIGDISILPIMLGWHEGDLKWGTNLTVYAPTGDFTPGRLANIGKNFWTFEPAVNISWLSTTIGVEATAFAGIDFNTRNAATDYQSGDQAYLDVTLAQHLPLLGGIAGLGANAFFYQQISGDSGSGAALGSFEGHTAGVGPVLSYIYRLGKADLVAEAKWLPELAVENRLKGDGLYLKLAISAAF